MKKTLIALAVAASAAVSGSALAAASWAPGDFSKTLNFGGSIIADEARQKWSWSAGDSMDNFVHTLRDMTENNTKLRITIREDKPILIGKTDEAFSVPVTGGAAAIPLISFTDAAGERQLLKRVSGSSGLGVGTLDLIIKNKDTDEAIGTLRATLTAAAVRGKSGDSNEVSLDSLYANDNNSIFSGGLPKGEGVLIKEANNAADFIALMGGLSSADILNQIKEVKPDVTSVSPQNATTTESMVSTNGEVISASYALGFKNGQTIVAEFTDAVSTTTQWVAPLNIAVTYN